MPLSGFVVHKNVVCLPAILFPFTYLWQEVVQATGCGVTPKVALMTLTTEIDVIRKTGACSAYNDGGTACEALCVLSAGGVWWTPTNTTDMSHREH